MRGHLCICFAAMLILMSAGVLAVSSTFSDSYDRRETMIGQLSENVIDPISREQVRMIRNQNVEVGFEFDVATIGGREFLWIQAPQNTGNYTLIIEDVVSIEEGSPQIGEFRHEFRVGNEIAPYSIDPGFIIADEGFSIRATLYEEFSQQIETSFPEPRSVTLSPGINTISYDLDGFIGETIVEIALGQYVIPAAIIGESHVCGDGNIDGPEVCDGANLGNKTCESAFGDDYIGELQCASDCLSYNAQQCEERRFCDWDNLDLCISENDCINYEGFWYDDECHYYDEGAQCSEAYVRLCDEVDDCISYGGYWYNDECNLNEEITCANGYIEQCLTSSDCEQAGGEWRLGECRVRPDATLGGVRVTPAIIRSTVLVDAELPTYSFSVSNSAKDIKDISITFNDAIISVTPPEHEGLGFNESESFTITVLNRSKDIREVIVVEYGDYRKFVLFNLLFTRQQENTGTNYLQDDGENAYYCYEIDGLTCSSEEVCEGQSVSTIDNPSCCTGECVPLNGGGGNAWIGYLIAAIIILVLLIIYTRYKKTGSQTRKNPMASRVQMIEKNKP